MSYLDWHVSHVRYEQIALPTEDLMMTWSLCAVKMLSHQGGTCFWQAPPAQSKTQPEYGTAVHCRYAEVNLRAVDVSDSFHPSSKRYKGKVGESGRLRLLRPGRAHACPFTSHIVVVSYLLMSAVNQKYDK